MEERAFHPLDYLTVVSRRKWWLIVPVAISVVVGALLAALWPREYISEAQIGVAAPTLSPELLRGVSSINKEERQQAVSQQLLSRNVLERVVRDEKLNPEKPVEDVAGWLRSTVGYSAARWLRLEGFHAFTRQDSQVTGGEINRQRIGAQVVVSQPMRIR